MIRLFVAIDLPGELRQRLAMLCHGPGGANWVAPENLHLTLRFIGEVQEPEIEEIVGRLRAIHSPPFVLTLAGAGHFESRRRVRALWIGIERSPALIALQGRVEAALQRAGLAPEGRRFSPHVTLARLKSGAPAEAHRWLAANGMFRAMPFTVAGFVLYSSRLGRGGASYLPVEEFPLAGPLTGAEP